MNVEEADKLIQAYVKAQAVRKRATEIMRALANMLEPNSVVVGSEFEMRRSSAVTKSRLDVYLLRRYVPAATLDMCRVRCLHNPRISIRKKKVPKKGSRK